VSMSRGRLRWGCAAVLLSAAAWWRGTGLEPAWWLTWLAPWPVLAFGLRARAPLAAAAAFSAWAGGSLNLWSYYRATIGMPLPVVLVAVAVPAIVFAACIVLMRALVLPERVVSAAGAEAVAHRFASLTEAGVTVVMGADRAAAGRETNAAIALQAGPPTVYAKHHLLQPFESRFQPGNELALLDSPSGRLGLAICKDMDFPDLGRRYAQRGAQVVLVPAWDFTADGWLHSRMAALRGVEGGFTVARAARGGRLTLSDDRGRILGEADSAQAPTASVLATARTGPAGTLYATLGDWFGWLSCGVLALAIVSSRRARGER
jgi:predicted amidohydrolase